MPHIAQHGPSYCCQCLEFQGMWCINLHSCTNFTCLGLSSPDVLALTFPHTSFHISISGRCPFNTNDLWQECKSLRREIRVQKKAQLTPASFQCAPLDTLMTCGVICGWLSRCLSAGYSHVNDRMLTTAKRRACRLKEM